MVDYESFEDVLKELNVDEDELKRLVSEGALRAYRDEDRMKFRKDDIEALQRANLTDLGSQPTLPAAPRGAKPGKPGAKPPKSASGLEVVEETDPTVLDIGNLPSDVDFEDTGATSVPTVEIDQPEDADATLTEELVFEDSDDSQPAQDADATVAMDDGLTLGDDDLGLSTEPLGGLDADATVVDAGGGELDLGGDDLQLGGGDELSLDGVGAAAQTATPYMVAPPPPMAAPQVQIQEKIKYVEIIPSETWWTKWIFGLLIFIMICLTIPAMIGIMNRQPFGLAGTVGWSAFGSGPMAQNPALKGKKEYGLRPKKPTGDDVLVTEPEYRHPNRWIITASETDSEQLFAPGMVVLRKFDGMAPIDGEAGYRKDDIRVTPAKMREEQVEPDFRRSKLLPTYRADDGSPSPSPAPAPAPAPASGS